MPELTPELLKYIDLPRLCKTNSENVKFKDNLFFVVDRTNRTETASATASGWKMHVSVDSEDLPKAYDLISGSIIYRYVDSHKVIDNRNAQIVSASRFGSGAQITIYLESTSKTTGERTLVSADTLSEMIEQINTTLRKANIRPGEVPESDAATASAYCSVRNDCILLYRHEVPQHSDYMPGKYTANHFNPSDAYNPYAELINRSNTASYKPLEYFQSFKVNSIKGTRMAALCTMVVFLRCTLDLDNIIKCSEDWLKFVAMCKSSHQINISLFKNKTVEPSADFIAAIKLAVIFVNQLKYVARAKFGRAAFDSLAARYPYDNPFKSFLVAVEGAIKTHEYALDLDERLGYLLRHHQKLIIDGEKTILDQITCLAMIMQRINPDENIESCYVAGQIQRTYCHDTDDLSRFKRHSEQNQHLAYHLICTSMICNLGVLESNRVEGEDDENEAEDASEPLPKQLAKHLAAIIETNVTNNKTVYDIFNNGLAILSLAAPDLYSQFLSRYVERKFLLAEYRLFFDSVYANDKVRAKEIFAVILENHPDINERIKEHMSDLVDCEMVANSASAAKNVSGNCEVVMTKTVVRKQ